MNGSETCTFCAIIQNEKHAVLVCDDTYCKVIMSIHPFSRGQVVVIPKEHAALVEDLSPEMREHLFHKAAQLSYVLCHSELKAKATNFLINNGREANQHIPHVHLHVIPRYSVSVWPIIGTVATRVFNPFPRWGRRKRLEKMSVIIQRFLENQPGTSN